MPSQAGSTCAKDRRHHRGKLPWAISLALCGGVAATGPLNGQGLCVPENIAQYTMVQKQIVVPLDNLGVAKFSFRNPRKPFALFRELQQAPGESEEAFGRRRAEQARVLASCREQVLQGIEVFFDNQALDRSFDVAFNFELPVPTEAHLRQLISVDIADLRRRLREPGSLRVGQAAIELVPRISQAVPDQIAGQVPVIKSGEVESDKLPQLKAELQYLKTYLGSLRATRAEAARESERLANLRARRDELARRSSTPEVVQEKDWLDSQIEAAERAPAVLEGVARESEAAEDLEQLEPQIDQALEQVEQPTLAPGLEEEVETALGIQVDEYLKLPPVVKLSTTCS